MYSIEVESGLLSRVGPVLRNRYQADRCYLLTDANVARFHLHTAVLSLTQAGYVVDVLVLPAGEHIKNMNVLSTIYQWLLDSGANRSSVLMALGGGVICDLGGFAAATFMRGIGLINIPTSLLAQVDAGVGGKVGVNFAGIKNLVGSFYDPLVVLVDPDVLATLDKKDYANGMGELVKYALLGGQDLRLSLFRHKVNSTIIRRCLDYKMSLTECDPRDFGKRRLLNLGHTLGHALEAAFLNSRSHLSHGEAVALGCIGEAVIAVKRNYAEDRLPQEIALLCRAVGLRDNVPLTESQKIQILDLIKYDKKRQDAEIFWALPCGWGKVQISTGITVPEVMAALEYLSGKSLN